MSSEEYWDGEPSLAQCFLRHYRNEQKAKFEEENFNCWLQGLYNYHALIAVLGQLFSREKDEANYIEKPINFFETEEEKRERFRAEQLKRAERFLDSF